jgi:hypothetical protein
VRAYVREQQRLRRLHLRGREAMRDRAAIEVAADAGSYRPRQS